MTKGQKLALPFSLTLAVFALDQITKQLIVSHFPLTNQTPLDVFGNNLLWIYHVRNKAIAFSLGGNLPDTIRPLLFVVLPVALLIFLLIGYFKTNEFTYLQRWLVAGIVGGGAGNLADRIFRPEGVVDFISVKFFGIFGFERWPTFNVADSAVVVCVIIWLVTVCVGFKGETHEQKA